MKKEKITVKTISSLLALILTISALAACSLDTEGQGDAWGDSPLHAQPEKYGPKKSDSDYIKISDFFAPGEAEELLGEKIKASTVDSTSNSWCVISTFITDSFNLTIKLYQEALVKQDDPFIKGDWHGWIEKKKAELADRANPNTYFYEAGYSKVDDVGDIAYLAEFTEKNWWYFDIFYADYYMNIELKYGQSIEKTGVGVEDFQYIGRNLIERLKFMLTDSKPNGEQAVYNETDLASAVKDLPDYDALKFICNRLNGYWTGGSDWFFGFAEGSGLPCLEYGLFQTSHGVQGEITNAVATGEYLITLTLYIPAVQNEMDGAKPERTETVYIDVGGLGQDGKIKIKTDGLDDGEWHIYRYGGKTVDEAYSNLAG